MSQSLRFTRVGTPAALAAMLLSLLAAACEEDGKTAPEKCLEPPLAIYDIQAAGAPGETENPCVTPVGHAVNQVAVTGGTGGTATGSAGAP